MKLIIYSLTLVLFVSCEKKCELKPIPKNIFDIEKINNKSIILESGKNIDSLTFNDKYDSYTDNSFNGPLKHKVCKHSKAYKYNFRNETIQICLDKNDKNVYEFSLNGWFNKSNDFRILKENDLLQNKEYTFEREADCDSSKSQIKRVILKGYLIKTIITIDNKEWRPK